MGWRGAGVRRRDAGHSSQGRGFELTWPNHNQSSRFHGTLQEGLGCFIYPTKRFKTVTIHAAWVRELTEPDNALGAMLVEVMRRGTESWPERIQVEARLEELYGATFRADIGKLGDKQLLSFYITITHGQFLPGNPDTVRDALDFLTEVLDRPHRVDGLFPSSVVDQEKTLLKRQIAAIINDKGQYAMSRLMELVADGRRFGLRKLGTEKAVERVTPESLSRFYEAVHRDATFLFTVVGDVDENMVQQYFSEHWRKPRHSLSTIQPLYKEGEAKTVVEPSEVRQGKLNLAYRTHLTAQSHGFPALMMYSGILGGFSHSKLFMNVREKASLAYYAYSRLDPALALMFIGAGIEFKDYQAARDIIEAQVLAVKKGEFSEDEMTFTVKAYANDILSEQDSPPQLIGRHLEEILVGGGQEGTALIESLKTVTRDEIIQAASGVELDTVFFLTEQEESGHEE